MINDESLRSKMSDNQFNIYFKASNKLENTKSQTKRKEFEFNEKLIYIYLNENEDGEENEFKNAKDIQRFCYYPGTQKIYSFYGFSSKKDIIDSIINSKLKINEIFNIQLYSKNKIDISTNDIAITEDFEEKMIHNFKKVKKVFVENGINKTKCITNSKQKTSILVNKSNSKKSVIINESNSKNPLLENQSKSIENCTKNANDDIVENHQKVDLTVLLFIDYFVPDMNLFYVYFYEKTKPDSFITSQHYKKIRYKNFYIEDIQRFYYFKEKHSSYSFFGFLSKDELFQFKIEPTIKTLATNETLYIYSNESKIKYNGELPNKGIEYDDDLFQEFKPKERVFYIYFREKKGPNPWKMRYRNRSIHEIRRPYDVQRYSYYPNEKNIYSFFGFSTIKQLKSNIENPNLIFASLTGKIYFYTENIKLNHKSKYLDNLLNALNQNNVTLSCDDKHINSHFNYEFNDNSITGNIKVNEFCPKENIFYVYFQEILTSDSKGFLQINNLSKYIKYAADIQRYYFYPGSNEIYSFIGFKNKKHVDNIINDNSLKLELGKRQIHIYLKCLSDKNNYQGNKDAIDEFKHNEKLIYIYLKEKNEKEEMIKSQNIKDCQRICYFPGTKEFFSFYGYSNKKDMIASIKNSRLKINDILNIRIYFKDKHIDETFLTNMISISENFEDKIISENSKDLIENSFKNSPNKKNIDKKTHKIDNLNKDGI